MKILVLHLSDIHFSAECKQVSERVENIVAAALNVEVTFDQLLIVLSGDIGAQGKNPDYKLALEFVIALQTSFRKATSSSLAIEIVTVAGNHDVDVSVLGEDTIDALANSIVKNSKNLTSGLDLYRTLLTGQEEYLHFQQQASCRQVSDTRSKLAERFSIALGGKTITVTGLNTAALSRRHEQQGLLSFPLDLLSELKESQPHNDLSVLVFHHPERWLESNNGARFRALVEAYADIILMGHQHTPDSYFAESLSGDATWYSAGDVLQTVTDERSGFNVLLFDFNERSRRRVEFVWRADLYTIERDTGVKPFRRNALARAGFVVSDAFNETLDDPGNLITHIHKRKVFLGDIYEPCRLKLRTGNTQKDSVAVLAGDLPSFLADHPRVLILGDPQCGKSTLAKHLFRQLLNASGGTVPLLLHRQTLKSASVPNIEQWMKEHYEEQYGNPSFKEFRSLSREDRVLLIDDWQDFHLNEEGKGRLLSRLETWASRIIIFADSWYQLEELSATTEDVAYATALTSLFILPYAPWQRSNMIERWVTLGREEEISVETKVYDVNEIEREMDALTATGILPKYPLHILTVLQTFQATQRSEPDMGAQGQLYDILIDRALKAMSEDAPQMNINRHFIALLAGEVFRQDGAPLTIGRIHELASDYLRGYAIRIEVEPLLKLLVAFRFLRQDDTGYAFRERYVFFYFVAEFFVSKLNHRIEHEEALRKLKMMTDYIAYEEYAQILMFVIYKTRNSDLIDEIIINCQMILEGVSPCEFDKDVDFINQLNISRPKVALPEGDVQANRRERRQQQGEDEDRTDQTQRPSEKVKYSVDLDSGSKIQFAFKAMQLMGRILRNFPGNLEAETKRQLAQETYSLGLRTLTLIFNGMRGNLDTARRAIRKAIQSHSDKYDDIQSEKRADVVLTFLVVGCGMLIAETISESVGSSKLVETYRQLGSHMEKTVATELMQLAVELDHFKQVPTSKMFAMEEALTSNFVAYQLLRYLVWKRIVYLPLSNRLLRNQLCERFAISVTPYAILNAEREV